MPRTEVYQLRLTKAEKDLLASKARDKGISIAQLLRSGAGLFGSIDYADDGTIEVRRSYQRCEENPMENGAAAPLSGKPTKVVKHEAAAEVIDGLSSWPDVQANDEAISEVVNGELKLSKLIKQLEAQGNPSAEETARKRLGL